MTVTREYLLPSRQSLKSSLPTAPVAPKIMASLFRTVLVVERSMLGPRPI